METKPSQIGSRSEPTVLMDSSGSPNLNIEINGKTYQVPGGINLAAALWSLGWRAWGSNPAGSPRSLFCGMGICFDCLVKVDGRQNVQACTTQVRQGMRVEIPETMEIVRIES